MKNRAAALVLAAYFLSPVSPLAADANDVAGNWLERMSAAMSQMTYQGTFVYVRGDEVETMRITHVSDQTGVRERLVSVSGVQREILRDSNGVRWVQSEDHSVMTDPAFDRSFFPEIPLRLSDPINDSYTLQLGNTERIAGHSGRKVSIIPKDEYRYGYTFWLEEQSALLLKWELLNSKNQRLAKLMFTDLRLGSEVDLKELKSANQLQEFKSLETGLPASGSLSHSNPSWRVSNLPVGFRLTAHRYMGKSDSETYEHLVYSDGLAVVSVYVEGNNKDFQKQETGLSRMGTTNAFSRMENGVLITVVGDVPAITVKKFGESVEMKAP